MQLYIIFVSLFVASLSAMFHAHGVHNMSVLHHLAQQGSNLHIGGDRNKANMFFRLGVVLAHPAANFARTGSSGLTPLEEKILNEHYKYISGQNTFASKSVVGPQSILDQIHATRHLLIRNRADSFLPLLSRLQEYLKISPSLKAAGLIGAAIMNIRSEAGLL